MEKEFIEMCNDIYHRGMLDFEITCEKIIMESFVSENIKSKMQEVLDLAQKIFEESKGK